MVTQLLCRRNRPSKLGYAIIAALVVFSVLHIRDMQKGESTGVAGNGGAMVPDQPHNKPMQQDNRRNVVDHPVAIQKPRFVPKNPDAKHLHGEVGVKPDGTPAWTPLPDFGPETMEDKTKHHHQNCFNLRKSDSIPLDRDVPDVRHPECRKASWDLSKLPNTSVIFVFFNEPLSPLYRSIHSVLDRTPPELLHEIILVDDGSDAEWLQEELEEYIKTLPKIVLHRCPNRQGLMDARSAGARVATGQTITFLDSHIECNLNWLEPMLARIAEDKHHVVMPEIDSIDPDTFQYRGGGLDILGFSWSLGQKGIAGRKRSGYEAMPSPVMAGGLFAMDREYFHALGGYDPLMKLYGGEEMEISFRIWQCGGTLECIPCSRVGHVFRTGKYWKGQVYPVPGYVIIRNKLRAAEVWMDEYKDIAKSVMGGLPPGEELGPIDQMLAIREKFNCKPFKWFLENIYPELFVPFDPRFVKNQGEFQNPDTHACLDTLGARHEGSPIGVYPCHGHHGTQEFVLTQKKEIRVAAMDFDTCLDTGGQDKMLVWSCHTTGGNQQFDLNSENQLQQAGKCLEVIDKKTPSSSLALSMRPCDASNPRQKWKITKNP